MYKKTTRRINGEYVRTNIHVRKELREVLFELAEEQQCSLTVTIEQACEFYLFKNHPHLFSFLKSKEALAVHKPLNPETLRKKAWRERKRLQEKKNGNDSL